MKSISELKKEIKDLISAMLIFRKRNSLQAYVWGKDLTLELVFDDIEQSFRIEKDYQTMLAILGAEANNPHLSKDLEQWIALDMDIFYQEIGL